MSFGRKEQAPVGQLSTQADADGRYSFSGVNRDPNFVYLVLARYQNVNYPTDQPFQLQDQPNHQTDITVYDATTADDAIKLERLNLLVVGADQGVVQFMEMGSLVNSGDRTFVTANPQDQALARALKFALPNGALGVQMQTGFNDQDVIAGVGGVQVTSPVPPGSHQFAMSFQLPYSGSSADVSMQMPYPTGTYSVYLPDTGIKLDASGLTSGGPAQLGGQSYALYTANNLSKATMVGGQLVRPRLDWRTEHEPGGVDQSGRPAVRARRWGAALRRSVSPGCDCRGRSAARPISNRSVSSWSCAWPHLDERFAAGRARPGRVRRRAGARQTTPARADPRPSPRHPNWGVKALSAEGLTARYPGQPTSAPALIDVDLEVEAGERLLLLGPNGAGKSTFIRVFAGLMHAAQGRALVRGQPARSARNLVGVVSHATYLYDELTALENLRFYAELYRVHRPLERAVALLEEVGLAHLANAPVGRLSRGQQQRVTIARALLHDPPVLLLDEPDTGLDLAAFALVAELTTGTSAR